MSEHLLFFKKVNNGLKYKFLIVKKAIKRLSSRQEEPVRNPGRNPQGEVVCCRLFSFLY